VVVELRDVENVIAGIRVRIDNRIRNDLLPDNGQERGFADVRDHHGVNFAAALKDAEDRDFAGRAAPAFALTNAVTCPPEAPPKIRRVRPEGRDGRMKRSRFTEEQIIGVLREQEAGLAVTELCRKHGVSSPTFYKWKAKYGGLEVSEARRLKALEDENAKLKGMLADAMLDNVALKDLLGKKW
jgi:putative transposase